MPKRPPKKWFDEKVREIGAGLRKAHPDWSKDTLDQRTRATVGNIWHNVMSQGQRQTRVSEAERKKAFYGIFVKAGLGKVAAYNLAVSTVKDFGGWTSQNLDWERGYREGERKQEDRQRGIKVQRTREAQLHKKQGDQSLRYTDPDSPVRIEQRRERQAGLRYRAGERKGQHQPEGAVVANVVGKDDLGPLADPEKHGRPFYEDAGEEPTYVDVGDVVEGKGKLHPEMEKVQDHPGQSCDDAHANMSHDHFLAHQQQKQFFGHNPVVLPLKVKRYSLFMPFEVKVVTKAFGDVQKGDLIVEGFVSAPIKDLQGDVLELPALTQAKQSMTMPPHNLVWLDHESPYAKPIENQGTPPIGKFVESKILKVAGLPALWARMVVNKAHPSFEKVAYELKNGFYNAFSMEFIPQPGGQSQKWIGSKLVNAISSIKYFATSLVRAPANEVATINRVYEKAFANSSRFMPIRVKSAMGFGQTVIQKGENRKLTKRKEAEPENEPEPELEPELEPEPWTEQEGQTGTPRITGGQKPSRKEAEPDPESEAETDDGDDGDDGDGDGTPEFPYSRKDYDRETGYVAPERASTAIGEWGDPALEKGRATIKRIERLENYAQLTGKSVNRLGVYAQRQTQFLKAIAQQMGIETKGIDEGLAPDTLGVYDDFTTITDEQKPPEVKPGKLKPRPQRFISTFPTDDEDTEEADSQEVGGDPVGVKSLQRAIKGLVRKAVDEAVSKKIVVRKGYAEHAGPVPESVRQMQAMQQDDGSLESQLAVVEAGGY